VAESTARADFQDTALAGSRQRPSPRSCRASNQNNAAFVIM